MGNSKWTPLIKVSSLFEGLPLLASPSWQLAFLPASLAVVSLLQKSLMGQDAIPTGWQVQRVQYQQAGLPQVGLQE